MTTFPLLITVKSILFYEEDVIVVNEALLHPGVKPILWKVHQSFKSVCKEIMWNTGWN